MGKIDSMRCFLLPLIIVALNLSVLGQRQIAAEAEKFIPSGYQTLDYVTGDLNGDKKPDAILLLKKRGEEDIMDEETKRPFLLLIRRADGKLAESLRNDEVIMCRQCGGAFGDPYSDLTINNNGFSIYFYGGSNWRWTYAYDFSYKPLKKNWYLQKQTYTSFNSTDPEITLKETVIDAQELGEISISAFSSSPVYEDSRWKVRAIKTYFYDQPKAGSKPKKSYLVKGNILTGIRQLKNFVEVSYENKEGTITTGFILKKDLLLLK